jgi:NADPH2:quinone reductase
MTAHCLSHSTYPLKPGDWCIVHAAAGGVGQLLCQMAKMRGAKVIGTVSSETKANAAHQAGADHVLVYARDDFAPEVKRLTNGKGVNVVYDSLGKATFDKSLDSLARRGYMVLYGEATGLPPAIQDVRATLQNRGSLYLTRVSVADYLASREELLERAGQVLAWIAEGRLRVRVDRTFPLAQAAEAHRALESRQTIGKIVLLP